MSDDDLQIVLPSDGVLGQPTLDFFHACNLTVRRPSARRYTGTIPSVMGAAVLFQRASEVTGKVEDGSAVLGVTGLDRFLEYRREDGDAIVLIDNLGFGGCELVIATPSSWLDVTNLDDLADLALEFRQDGKQLRIATKYPRLVRRLLLEREINHFSLVMASGAIEAAPAAGYADLIADITGTGTTLRENRLRPLDDGIVLVSQACIIGNKGMIAKDPVLLEGVKLILELMDAYLQARGHYRISANIKAESEEAVASKILERPDLAGLKGPTVSRVYNADGEGWYSVSLLVYRDRLLEMMDHLRQVGATEVSTTPVDYMFKEVSSAYDQLLHNLET